MKYWKPALAILAAVSASFALAEDFGEITLPLVVLPKSALKKTSISVLERSGGRVTGLNESESLYPAKKKKEN